VSDQGPPKQAPCLLSRSKYLSERGRSEKSHSDTSLNTDPNVRGLWLRVFLTASLLESVSRLGTLKPKVSLDLLRKQPQAKRSTRASCASQAVAETSHAHGREGLLQLCKKCWSRPGWRSNQSCEEGQILNMISHTVEE